MEGMTEKKKKLLFFCLDIVIFFALTAFDRWSKNVAVMKLKGQPGIPLIEGVLEWSYLENRGAAFGLFQNQKTFFVIGAIVYLCAVIYAFCWMPADKKYFKLRMPLLMIACGAAGNMMDRLQYDYVVDFIYFSLIDFPVFNVADIYVTTATAILAVEVLFVFQEKDFAFLKWR